MAITVLILVLCCRSDSTANILPPIQIDNFENSNKVELLPGQYREWKVGNGGLVFDSRFWLVREADEKNLSVEILGGGDRQGVLSAPISSCEPGASYRFEADFYRYNRLHWVYPKVRIWGQEFSLNTHRMYGEYQTLHAKVRCPIEIPKEDMMFSFLNEYSGVTFRIRNPQLIKEDAREGFLRTLPESHLYPIGVYGASAVNLEEIKKSGLNSAILGFTKENIEQCLSLEMHCTLSVPRDPERLIVLLDEFKVMLKQGRFSFYVNDEPGIYSFPKKKAEYIQQIIKERFPQSFTNMAVVRPQVIPEFEGGADYFMLDQYPVPNKPMVWLSESLDEAAAHVGRDRLQSVIQAFGGERFAKSGWPRLPTFEEMDCLAFLSVIHGSRGIYFFTYPVITATEQGRTDFKKVVVRLNSLRSWLEKKNLAVSVEVTMASHYKYDPLGKPAVHCAVKEQNKTKMLMCVNTLRAPVEAEIAVPDGGKKIWQDYFSDKKYYELSGTLLEHFKPLEVKVLIEHK